MQTHVGCSATVTCLKDSRSGSSLGRLGVLKTLRGGVGGKTYEKSTGTPGVSILTIQAW